jgi:hypothetical protein
LAELEVLPLLKLAIGFTYFLVELDGFQLLKL